MTIDRSLWAESFDAEHFPTLPCPKCSRGRVSVDEETLINEEPNYSRRAKSDDGWEGDWTVERFCVRLRCLEEDCGEIVVVSGDTVWVETFEDEFGWGFVRTLHPVMMFPPPPIISLPEKTPTEVRKCIESSFGLFWLDIGSSANKLRVSLECLLDHLHVPRSQMSPKTGKTTSMNLNNRIQYYEKSNQNHGDTFTALRIVGNLGSHGASLTREVLLDALEIYENALSDIIGGRSAYLAGIKKKIIQSRGKY